MQLSIVVAALIGVVYALPRRDDRIVGGSPAPIEMYPFMASMQITWVEGHYAHVCGGSLITTTAVLSATHCFILVPNAIQWRARLGSALNSAGGAHHAVSHFNLHPDYVPVLWLNDVAIVRLVAPAILSNTIQVARIAGPNYPLPDNLRLYVAGWGATFSGDHEGSETLLHTYVHIINQELCAKRYDELRAQPGMELMAHVTPEMFCAGLLDVGGQDACQGDSGGPVVDWGDVIVGVTSWGYDCAHPHYPGVSARVPSYTQWIVDNAVA
ncbi:trypsin CFT-1-like [Bicyclus anynana]|uniref:Trypsin CFT-1-like n=1 Tax=Bicyclus anynana TaxID=110368 RepID=A0ABM3LKH9_BICAN|nr:trypsin CFT-1-like [Bicyclus anynana]